MNFLNLIVKLNFTRNSNFTNHKKSMRSYPVTENNIYIEHIKSK